MGLDSACNNEKDDPNIWLAAKNQGDKERDAGNYKEALSLYDRAIQLRPQFWGAHYERGYVLLRLGQHIDAANSFMASWLHSRFRKEPALMCGRALVLAKFYLEACLVFEKIPLRDLDAFSALMYAESLQKEGRAREAILLEPLFKDLKDPALHRVMGSIWLELGNVPKARKHLNAVLELDIDGYVFDRMIAVCYAEGNYNELRCILDQAVSRIGLPYYEAQRTALDVIEGYPVEAMDSWVARERNEIVESAIYIRPHLSMGCVLSGTTYQTFDIVKDKVPSSGLLLEFGVRNGHTIHYLAEIYPNHKLYGFDSFEGLPEAWNDEEVGSYSALGRLPKVPQNVEFVVGWFNDTLPEFKIAHPEPIALMNIDCDLYSSTKTIFDQLGSQIVSGTIIVFDEYLGNKTWRDDEFKAFQEWVIKNNVKYQYLVASLATKQVAVRILARS